MSAVCMAKTLVLLEMMQGTAATVDQVLQVWYSSAWSRSTLEHFRQAITTLLTAAAAVSKAPQQQRRTLHPSADALLDSDVLGLLRRWQVKQVPIKTARQGWAASSDGSFTWLCNFARKADRVALAEVELTGEIAALGAGDVGSVVMFAVPQDKFGERAFDECVLQSLSFFTLADAWRSQPGSDVVTVAVGLLRQRTGALMRLLQGGHIQPEVHVGAVTLSKQAVVASIHALQPYTVSWSNVPDYMTPRDFHKLARAISATEDTVHFMHSMNWVKAVKGAFHLDYMMMVKEQFLPEVMGDFKHAGEAYVGMCYMMTGVRELLLCPPVDQPRNIIDLGLFIAHHESYIKAFLAESISGIRSLQRQVMVVEPPSYCVYSRTNSTMHITFTYDHKIRFQGRYPGM